MTFTKRAVDIFAPTDAGGAPRGPVMAEAQTWGSEVETRLEGGEIVLVGPGFDPTGATDSGAAINAAILANPGKLLSLPAGDYTHSAPIQLLGHNTVLKGVGRGTRLISTSATANCVEIGSGVNAIENAQLRDLVIWTSVTKTAGWAILARKCYTPIIYNVDMGNDVLVSPEGANNRLYHGIWFDKFFNPLLWGGQIFCQKTQVKFNGNDDGSFGQEAWISGNIKMRFGEVHIHVAGGTGGINLGRMDAAEAIKGLLINQDEATAVNREVKQHPDCTIDSCRDVGIEIDQPTASSAQFILKGWTASTGRLVPGAGIGVDVKNANGARVLVHGKVYNHTASGLVIRDANALVEVDASFDTNGQYDINPTVAVPGLTVAPSSVFRGAGLGDFNTSVMDRPVQRMNALSLRHNPTLSWSFDVTDGAALSIATGAAAQLAAGGGFVFLNDDGNGDGALFFCGGGNITKIGGSASFVVGTPGSSQIGLRFNSGAGRYEVANGYGATRTIRVADIKTRTTA